MSREINSLSSENVDDYVLGCEQIAETLDAAVGGILEQHKRPTILIPSRGAVPIYLIATGILDARAGDSRHLLLDRERTRYYPNKIFEYLSNNRIKQNGPIQPEVEVVLYPFTADVTSERQEERLAKQLRASSSSAFLDLISGDRSSLDFDWYAFLMDKMKIDAYDVELNPKAIVKSLETIDPTVDRQVILIDTVISGRASSQIVSSFSESGHPVVPILAVDSVQGSGRFQDRLKNRIVQNMAWYDYMSTQPGLEPFIEFPLITEDKGAGLLGVTAINFANFNEPGFFSETDSRFPLNFLPQSCLWSLPPTGKHREDYSKAFYSFVDLCLKRAGGQEISELPDLVSRLRPLIAHHGEVSFDELIKLAKAKKGACAKESSSHIISITLEEEQAKDWVKEFGNSVFKKVA